MKTSILLVTALFAALSFSMLTTACGDEACTGEESAACSSKYTTCMTTCGSGNAPGYAACVDTCGTRLCECENACGNDCDEDDLK